MISFQTLMQPYLDFLPQTALPTHSSPFPQFQPMTGAPSQVEAPKRLLMLTITADEPYEEDVPRDFEVTDDEDSRDDSG